MATIKIFFRDETIDEVSLNEGITTIGRDVKNDIQVDNLSASGRHAEIINHNSICMLTDLDSTNGTFVNGNRINKPHNLQEGDIIAISKHTLKFYDTSSNKHSKSNHVPQEHHISDASETMMMNKSQLSSLLGDHKIEDASKKGQVITWLDWSDSKHATGTVALGKGRVIFGKGATADIQAGGWFAPRVSATISFQGENYMITPEKRGNVYLNGKSINKAERLRHGDNITCRGASSSFSIKAVVEPTF